MLVLFILIGRKPIVLIGRIIVKGAMNKGIYYSLIAVSIDTPPADGSISLDRVYSNTWAL
jgi:hypothetical protein